MTQYESPDDPWILFSYFLWNHGTGSNGLSRVYVNIPSRGTWASMLYAIYFVQVTCVTKIAIILRDNTKSSGDMVER